MEPARKRIAVGCAAALLVLVGVLPLLAWGGLCLLQRELAAPPYQIKIVNPTSHRIEHVVLHSEGFQPVPLGDFEPGAVRTFKPEIGETSIYLTHDVGNQHFESEPYYFAWEFIYAFIFTETGDARVSSQIYPFGDTEDP